MNAPRDAADSWPDFRGPAGDGYSAATGLPKAWAEGRNVRWKAEVPEVGWSSPVVAGDKVWLTTATDDGREQFVLCYDRNTGKRLLNKRLFQTERPQRISSGTNTYASPSPVLADGRVFVHFGTFGTACLDTKTLATLWVRDDLHCEHSVGPGSSPFVSDGRLIVTFDGMDVQFLEALDVRTGKTVWKTPRGTDFNGVDGEMRKAFNTPYRLKRRGKDEIVSVGARALCAYDPKTGRELWRLAHPGYSNASRCVAGGGMLFVNTGFNVPELWAVRLDRPTGPTEADIAWRWTRSVPTMGSPLYIDGRLYFLADSEFLTCLDAATGRELWKERIGGRHYASPIFADGRLFTFAERGESLQIAPGATFQLLTRNRLDDGCHASPAVAGKALFVRTHTHLYRIEENHA